MCVCKKPQVVSWRVLRQVRKVWTLGLTWGVKPQALARFTTRTALSLRDDSLKFLPSMSYRSGQVQVWG